MVQAQLVNFVMGRFKTSRKNETFSTIFRIMVDLFSCMNLGSYCFIWDCVIHWKSLIFFSAGYACVRVDEEQECVWRWPRRTRSPRSETWRESCPWSELSGLRQLLRCRVAVKKVGTHTFYFSSTFSFSLLTTRVTRAVAYFHTVLCTLTRCCETCQDVKDAYQQKGWRLMKLDEIVQCKDEAKKRKEMLANQEGCQLYGYLSLNRVSHF
jgi:hypothetical protein